MIEFFSEEIDFNLPRKDSFAAWLNKVATAEGQQIETLNYIFCSDEYLLRINQEYLQHDYYTDVITFDHREQTETPVEGDIFISIERIAENAAAHEVPLEHELSRVMVHGLLHLLGYEDTADDQKLVMRKKEEAYLSLQKQNEG